MTEQKETAKPEKDVKARGEINVSVRGIVEFILRSGNIDSGYISQSRMQEGVRIHQRIQKRRKKEAEARGAAYEAEARLKLSFEYGGLRWCVSGVADGITLEDDGVVIEEIKSTTRALDDITEDESHWHMAQAKCYGHMYAELHGAENVTVNLTYCDLKHEDIRTFSHSFTAGELKAFFYDLAERYLRWAKLKRDKIDLRNETVKSATFPYQNYRKGQREFAVLAYRAVQKGGKLFIEAPTGTGKTISALFPSVKALGEDLADKIFYLTAKTITRQAAEQAAGFMAGDGCRLTYVSMTARDKLCVLPERACNPVACPCANGHFDRVNDALWELLSRFERITREEILDTAATFTVCPYELMLDAALFADLIICDYNYVFDPTVSLKRFFGDKAGERYVFLIDEAHNLVERAREMFSATITGRDFSSIKKAFRGPKGTKGKQHRIGKIITLIQEEIKTVTAVIPPERDSLAGASKPRGLYDMLQDFKDAMDEWLTANAAAELFAECMETYFRVIGFLRVFDDMDDRFTVYLERGEGGGEITLYCLDPSGSLGEVLAKSVGSVFFSATLTPMEYFKNVLGGGGADVTARLPSPFPAEHCRVVVENRISTLYRDRTPESYEAVAEAINHMRTAKRGNYFAFFSSYAYLERVLEAFNAKYPGDAPLVQGKNMSEAEKEGFLQAFTPESEVLAFVVMGGVFSEGIDLAGERLIGAAVVGVGLPQISSRRDALRDYYDRVLRSGFEYAYMYPGMNKVLQAAGRVLRSESDRGVILLIDGRFTDARYRELMPYNWRDYQTPSVGRGVGAVFGEFWEGFE